MFIEMNSCDSACVNGPCSLALKAGALKANADIRNAVATNGFKLWELAAALGINDGNLSRKLRTELPAAEREHILAVIAEMRSTQDGEVETNVNR